MERAGGERSGGNERRGEERRGEERSEREGLPPLQWRSGYAPAPRLTSFDLFFVINDMEYLVHIQHSLQRSATHFPLEDRRRSTPERRVSSNCQLAQCCLKQPVYSYCIIIENILTF